jgi:hypothetical protein
MIFLPSGLLYEAAEAECWNEADLRRLRVLLKRLMAIGTQSLRLRRGVDNVPYLIADAGLPFSRQTVSLDESEDKATLEALHRLTRQLRQQR